MNNVDKIGAVKERETDHIVQVHEKVEALKGKNDENK